MTETAATLDFRARFLANAARSDLLPANGAVVVGVSGGVDSICLLDLLRLARFELHAVHVNYGFRGADSEGDEELVRDVCLEWGVEMTVYRADEAWRLAAREQSLQEAARELRYRVMLGAARETGSRTVAVGHHRDDQVETILLRLFRGTGVQGLAAMRVKRSLSAADQVVLVRPLLFASRSEIASYASDRAIPFRNDRSNVDERFDRVKVRQIVLPAIKAAFGDGAVRNIGEAAERVREIIDDGVGPIVEADLASMADERADCVHLDLKLLSSLPDGRRKLVLLRALQRYLPNAPLRATAISRVEALLDALPGKRVAFDEGTIWRDRETLVFVPEPIVPAVDLLRIRPGMRNDTAFGSILIEQVDPDSAELSGDANTEVADGRVLDEPLSLGPWLPGERFQPLGLSGTKKISDFLTDAKIPTYLRSAMPVLRSGREVVWIPGLRLAHPFRLTPSSASAVRITFAPAR